MVNEALWEDEMADGTGEIEFSVAPGTPRHLRVFISHRHANHPHIYTEALTALSAAFEHVVDLSIPEHERIEGPRGGSLPDYAVRSKIAARIYDSDIFIAPSAVSMGMSDWTSYEIEIAAFAYSNPILFIKEPGAQRNASLVGYVKDHVEKCDEIELEEGGAGIARAVAKLVATDLIKSQPPEDRSPLDWLTPRTPDPEILRSIRKNDPFREDLRRHLSRPDRIRRIASL